MTEPTKPEGNGCKTCDGVGSRVKITQRKNSADVRSVRCPKCKGKGTSHQPVNLLGLVEALAGKKPG